MSGQNNRTQDERNPGNEGVANSGSQNLNLRASSSSALFNPNYRGPQNMGQPGNMFNANMNASGLGHPSQPRNTSVYSQSQGYGRGYPTGRGGHQGRGGPMPPYSGQPNPSTQLGSMNPQPEYQQSPFFRQLAHPPPAQQHLGRGTVHSGPARFPTPTPRGGHQQPAPPSIRGSAAGSLSSQTPQTTQASRSAQALPPAQAPRSGPAGRGTKAPSQQFGEEDFPSLGSQPHLQQQKPRRQQVGVEHELTAQLAVQSLEDQPKGGSGRGGNTRRSKFVPFTDYNVNISVPEDIRQRQAITTLPPPRTRRNEAFRLKITECYRGKIIFIDELSGIDYSNHPAIIRSIDPETHVIRFFKKSSFKGIGGFLNKYGEYVNQSQKRWHEKQWLLVDDGVTMPHHGTPLLKLANGEKMPERGSYVDIHGDTELPLDYFSKYSRFGVFPDIYLPEDQMKKLEDYSEWYLEKDEAYRRAEENKRKERWQVDGSADVDIGDVYDDSENEDGE
ncbi:hypothetical protein DBV05_g6464 [Lasiodiplodia theobromae]|uniref:Uncharacterized protein n=1 Tax=Lasiodiplodia theobromae TaxID=45133 RepID=A0A5N5DAV9_9PEZI|nr:hypothetical protein DBV05_g6464 [Lasiodiplodia theobromae]